MSAADSLPTEGVLDLLGAIGEALDVPLSVDHDARWKREILFDGRAARVKAVIHCIVHPEPGSRVDLTWWACYLRGLTAECPVTYPTTTGENVAEQAEGGGSRG